MYKAQYIDYNPHKGLTGEFVEVTELHGTEESARIRSKVKQWCLVSVKLAKRGAKK